MLTKLLPMWLLLFWSVSGCTPKDPVTTIGFVQIANDPVLDRARAGVVKALADSGFIEGQNIKLIYQNAQGDLSMVATILQGFQSRGVNLIITNGTPCMSAAAQMVRTIPVVFTVSFSPEQVGLASVPGNLSGVFDPFRADLFSDLIVECKPTIKRIGLPYNNAEPNAEYSAKRMKEALNAKGIEVITSSVNSVNDIVMAGQYLVGQRVEAIVVAADNTLFLGLNALAKEAEKQKIPIFVSEPLQTQKGASVGYGVDYDNWGYQSGLKAVEILKGRSLQPPRISPIESYQLMINLQAAQAQGLTVPVTVLERAERKLP